MFVSGAADYNHLISETVYRSSTQSSLSMLRSATGGGNLIAVTTFKLNSAATGDTVFQTGVVTADATNIIITWTKTGAPTGTYTLIWKANK